MLERSGSVLTGFALDTKELAFVASHYVRYTATSVAACHWIKIISTKVAELMNYHFLDLGFRSQ